ncbi:hypothetical protein F5884DRAFT_732843 [Xylogone sp. PMI_703]|nr:hypothetical protein F5884DRAFT_732843 [Xylogone sp. PMI_703]
MSLEVVAMASSQDNEDNQPSHSNVPSTPFHPEGPKRRSSKAIRDEFLAHSRRRLSNAVRHGSRHIRVEEPQRPNRRPISMASSIYMGSYIHSPRRSISRSGAVNSGASTPISPRYSMSQSQLDFLLQDLYVDLETYGMDEYRDGFFDASFLKPPKVSHEALMREAEDTLPRYLRKSHPLSIKYFLPDQIEEAKDVFFKVTTTRAGIKLTKSFLAFFIAYILCLVPAVNNWLGRYSYIMIISAVINHPGRTVGSQIDGVILTIVGTALGLGWGSLALWVSDSTAVAERGYGGILATFQLLAMGGIAALRSYYIRVYQLVISAGMSLLFTVLADTSRTIVWSKLYSYGISWLFGQAICLSICCTIFPDAGARPLAVALHRSFAVMQDSLILPQSNPSAMHRRLAQTFVDISQAYRDLVLDISITRFHPKDVLALRNLMQGVVRSLLSLKMETELFDSLETNGAPDGSSGDSSPAVSGLNLGRAHPEDEVVIDVDNPTLQTPLSRTDTEERAVKLVSNKLAKPTLELLSDIRSSLSRCDAVLMNMSGYRKYLGPPSTVSDDILGSLVKLRRAMVRYDKEEGELLDDPALPSSYSDHAEVVELFLFVRPIRQAATTVEALIVKVMEMQQRRSGWRLYLPSYPIQKALLRTNAQVRHDRGGLTAGFYFRSQQRLAEIMKDVASVYRPLRPRPSVEHKDSDSNSNGTGLETVETIGAYEEEKNMNTHPNAPPTRKLRYRIWLVLHRLQGFETRFALKVAFATTLLSVPAWLNQSRKWWNQNDSWWAVIFVWLMMHPRVGGNIQDLVTRALCGVLGALWGGLAYRAGNGSPYVIAVFAAIYMIPMMYRFTQSTHPRSGLVGCLSYIVISTAAYDAGGLPSVTQIAWTRGVAIVIGVVSAIVMNSILWPFVARHELRKALSAMLVYSSVIYSGVVAKYVYYEAGEQPGPEDIKQSEITEGRLREGFVRIRELMALTLHEIRLRGPFNPLPYSALIEGCERFFEYLVAVRQSSLFFHPHYMADNEQASSSLLSYRRDAVAAILMNLYVLAGALRVNRRVPRYLPNAAAARKRLLQKMAEIDTNIALQQGNAGTITASDTNDKEMRKWSQIYSYSYSQSLTGCVQQLEQLEKYVKDIVGEQGFDPIYPLSD